MTQLKHLSDAELINSLKKAKSGEDRALVSVLEHIQEFERRRLYLELGHPSIFSYLTKELNYSENEAYRRIESARMLRVAPQLKVHINEGRLSLTAISEVRSAIRGQERASNQKMPTSKQIELAEAVVNCSKKDAQIILANRLPFYKPVIFEQRRELGNGEMQITFRMTGNQREKSDRARDFLAHKGPVESMAALHENLCDFYLSKRDPQNFTMERISSSKATQSFLSRQEASQQIGGRVPTEIRRAVFRRDKGQCQFLSREGKICGSTHQIELDHIVPRAQGGSNLIENLRCVCRAHNQWKSDKPLERVIKLE